MPMSVVKKLGKQIQDQTLDSFWSKLFKASKEAAKGKGNGKAAGKSKPKGVCKVAPKPQHATKNDAKKLGSLPDCPLVGPEHGSDPISYGGSVVFSSLPTNTWHVYVGKGITHVVKWGRGRKQHSKNWENVKALLRKYK